MGAAATSIALAIAFGAILGENACCILVVHAYLNVGLLTRNTNIDNVEPSPRLNLYPVTFKLFNIGYKWSFCRNLYAVYSVVEVIVW